MVSSDFRKEARERMAGKWGKAVCITLVYFIVSFVLSFIQENTTGFPNLVISILSLLIETPLAFGLVICFVKLFNGENVKFYDFFSFGFDNFGKAWGIALRTFVKLIVPFILMFVSIFLVSFGLTLSMSAGLFAAASGTSSSDGFLILSIVGIILFFFSMVWLIVKSYYYELTHMIAAENPEMSSKEVVEKSKELMQNNRFKLFCLQFSFIGWIVLAMIPLGIGVIWVAPYMQFAAIAFYKHLIKE